MSNKSPVVLILGAGPKIGIPTAQAFASKGYKVAVAARSLTEADSTDLQLNINIDLAHPETVVDVFAKVKNELGIPSVVIYNGIYRSQTDPAHYLLSNHSCRRDILAPERPICNLFGKFSTRHDHQQYERFCSCSTGHTRLRGTPIRLAKGIRIHGQHLERQVAPEISGVWSWQVSICTYDDGCCG